MVESLTLSEAIIFFPFILQRLLGTVSETLQKRQRRRQDHFYFHETLYRKVTITKDPHLPSKSSLSHVAWSWQLSAFSAMCLSMATSPVPSATVRVAGFCVTQWSQWQFEIPVIQLMVSWVPGCQPVCWGWRARLRNLRVNCPAGICLDTFFKWMSSKTDVLWGVTPMLILSGWHTGCVLSLFPI